jgi:hypothetical protein
VGEGLLEGAAAGVQNRTQLVEGRKAGGKTRRQDSGLRGGEIPNDGVVAAKVPGGWARTPRHLADDGGHPAAGDALEPLAVETTGS